MEKPYTREERDNEIASLRKRSEELLEEQRKISAKINELANADLYDSMESMIGLCFEADTGLGAEEYGKICGINKNQKQLLIFTIQIQSTLIGHNWGSFEYQAVQLDYFNHSRWKEISNDVFNERVKNIVNREISEYIDKSDNIIPAGAFLYGIPHNEEAAKYHPENQRVFIYDGHTTADGYGKLIGWEDGKLKHSTGIGNWCWGGDVRLATKEEIDQFMREIYTWNGINFR